MVKYEDCFRNLKIFHTDKQSDLDEFYKEYTEKRANIIPPRRVLELLQVDRSYRNPRCKCVVLESNYIDRDYVDGYSIFYSKSFMDYEKRSKRFHFFSSNIKEDDILNSFQTRQTSLKKQEELDKSYLGYSLSCPSDPKTVGRTVISPPENSNWFVHGSGNFHINLFGFGLYAKGSPFIEQDYRISACATSAIWMAASSITRNYEDLQCLSTSQITLAAGSTFLPSSGRVIPNEGLTLHQVNWALKNMGFDPYVYQGDFLAPVARDVIYKYVESKLPVILVVRRDSGDHALAVVGHIYNPLANPAARYSREYGVSYYLSSDWVDGFIVHDDQRGPYLEIKLTEIEVVQENKRVRCCLITEEYLPGKKYEGLLKAIIVPFPKNVFVRAEQVEQKALGLFVKLCREAYGITPQNFVLRTFLMPSNEFKNNLTADSGMTDELVARYRGKLMSRYIWVTEVGALASRANIKPDDIKVYGEVLIDSTSGHRSKDFVAIHIPFYMIAMQPDRTIDWQIVPGGEYLAQ